ncbi:MAG: hypothetical protein WCJ01_03635 [Ignavibacteria bacterium]
MKTTKIKAVSILLETEEEVIMVAYMVSDLMGWDYVDDPEDALFKAVEIQEYLESQGDFILDVDNEQISYKKEFSAIESLMNTFNADDIIQFNLTPEMKERINDILTELDYYEEEDEEEQK